MNGPVIVDTNLLLLLVVGSADRRHIAKHKRLSSHYSSQDFDNLVQIVGLFPDLLLLPNILTEVSSFARHLGDPARTQVQSKLRHLIESTSEIYIESRLGAQRSEFTKLGLTDAILLHLCSLDFDELSPTLLSVDGDLINRAASLGCACIDYREWQ